VKSAVYYSIHLNEELMTEQYNGWANYETWRVNLEMLDGMTVEDFGYEPRDLDTDDYETIERLADSLEMYVCEMVEQDAKGFALDLAQSFLAKVDWMEIAEHMVADAKMELV
jgi:hypothetical protein